MLQFISNFWLLCFYATNIVLVQEYGTEVDNIIRKCSCLFGPKVIGI